MYVFAIFPSPRVNFAFRSPNGGDSAGPLESMNYMLSRPVLSTPWLVPNCGIKATTNARRGRECKLPQLCGPQFVRKLRDQSLQVRGPRLFNSLPSLIRNLTKVNTEEFKSKLDEFLSTLPDNPKIGDLVPSVCDPITMKPSNSIIHVINHVRAKKLGG